MAIIIREMRESDWPDVARIYQEGIDTNLATFQTEVPSYSEWDGAHLKICRLVAFEGDAPVGWVALTPYSKRAAYAGVTELSIYISGRHGGKGIGTQLLHALIAESELHGIWTLHSGIMANNVASLRLHTTCGFREVGYREKIGCDREGVWRDTVLMERRSKLVGVSSAKCP